MKLATAAVLPCVLAEVGGSRPWKGSGHVLNPLSSVKQLCLLPALRSLNPQVHRAHGAARRPGPAAAAARGD